MRGVSFLIVLSLLLTSCGGGGKREQAEEALGLYEKIEIGMPADEAERIIGAAGAAGKDGAAGEISWQKGENHIAVIIDPETGAIKGKKLDLADAHKVKPSLSAISEELRGEIKAGMSYGEVCDIVGCEGIQVQDGDWAGLGFELVSYKWFNPDGSYLLVQFDKDGKVLFPNFVKTIK